VYARVIVVGVIPALAVGCVGAPGINEPGKLGIGDLISVDSVFSESDSMLRPFIIWSGVATHGERPRWAGYHIGQEFGIRRGKCGQRDTQGEEH
jgi:hypothetical protein